MGALNLHHLRAFLEVARTGSLNRAAKAYGVASSTLSEQLAALEQSLAVELFDRRGRGLTITPAGQLLQSYADDIFRLSSEATDAIRTPHAVSRVVFRIGVVASIPKSVAYGLIQPAIAQLQGGFLVRVGGAESLLDDLVIGRLHVVLIDLPPATGRSLRLYAHRLGNSPIVLYATKDLARDVRENFPASLDGAPVLLPAGSTGLRRTMDRWFIEAGIRPRLVGEFDDAGMLRNFGSRGLGVFPVRSALRAEVEDAHDVEFVGAMTGVHEQYFAVSVQRRIRHPAVQALVEAARSELGAQRSGNAESR